MHIRDIKYFEKLTNIKWCSLNYWVRDIETEDIGFYCNTIEILLVEQLH